VLDAVYSALGHWMGPLSAGSPGARLLERSGTRGVVVPAAPERAVLNSVTYAHADGLRDAYDELAAAYAAAGASWTVWVRPGDADAARLLAERGHVLDAEPVAMARTLDEPPARPELRLDWTSAGSMADVAALNDLAYGYDGSFARTLSGLEIERGAVYVARSGGQAVGCLVMVDNGAAADVEWVAVAPEARGRGLSGRLLAIALADAAERGCELSTLVATRLGRPVYERLGFRGLGALQMWERRGPVT
jgi:GNAT superfamily N-acetyltransferase